VKLYNETHIAFADESNWNDGRYRSIAIVSCKSIHIDSVIEEFKSLIFSLDKHEFKWSKISRRHGISIVDFTFANLDKIKIDVLIWDTHDSRHKNVKHRDDIANFGRMYYHLLHFILKYKWEDKSHWTICPDINWQVDWLTIQECLSWKSWAIESNLLSHDTEYESIRDFYNIESVHYIGSVLVIK
jgi:hypothetical protein